MTRITQAYPLKLPQEPRLQQQVDWLHILGLQAAQHLLERLWSDIWVETLAASKKKAYKVIGEGKVRLTLNGQAIYLHSRIRRCIAEQVGRILRSQAVRKKCYYDVLRVVQRTGVEGPLNQLVKTVGWTLTKFYGKYYRWAIIRQTLRCFRRYHYRLGLDLNVLMQIPYTQMIKPELKTFIFPYAPDDGQALRLTPHNESIAIQMKLPITKCPRTAHDWEWTAYTLFIPLKIHSRLQSTKAKMKQPTLRYLTLKSGLILPFLECAWSFPRPTPPVFPPYRVLAVDLGVVHLTTSVICDAGSQISPPLFWSPPNTLLHRMEQLYHHVARLQRKLDRYPKNWVGQGKRREERARLYRKLKRYRTELLHLTSNQLVGTSLSLRCRIIVLEDLRKYEPPKHQRKLSRKLSNWFRGALYEVITYKANRLGIKVRRVNPWGTSTYCPRCGAWGQKIGDPSGKKVDQKGRFFHCPGCQFTADRDYIAALNIYRSYQAQRQKNFSLNTAKPVSYRGTGIPLNRPSGASAPIMVGG